MRWKAVLFDMDGVLIESEALMAKTGVKALKKFGIEANESDFADFVGCGETRYIGGVAADGKTAKDTRTPEQRKALLMLLRRLRAKYPNAKIHGHRDFAAKACPSFDATKEYADL